MNRTYARNFGLTSMLVIALFFMIHGLLDFYHGSQPKLTGTQLQQYIDANDLHSISIESDTRHYFVSGGKDVPWYDLQIFDLDTHTGSLTQIQKDFYGPNDPNATEEDMALNDADGEIIRYSPDGLRFIVNTREIEESDTHCNGTCIINYKTGQRSCVFDETGDQENYVYDPIIAANGTIYFTDYIYGGLGIIEEWDGISDSFSPVPLPYPELSKEQPKPMGNNMLAYVQKNPKGIFELVFFRLDTYEIVYTVSDIDNIDLGTDGQLYGYSYTRKNIWRLAPYTEELLYQLDTNMSFNTLVVSGRSFLLSVYEQDGIMVCRGSSCTQYGQGRNLKAEGLLHLADGNYAIAQNTDTTKLEIIKIK